MARILVSMPEEFLSTVDNIAQQEQRSRSELVREALRAYIKKTRIGESVTASKNAAILEDMLN